MSVEETRAISIRWTVQDISAIGQACAYYSLALDRDPLLPNKFLIAGGEVPMEEAACRIDVAAIRKTLAGVLGNIEMCLEESDRYVAEQLAKEGKKS